MFLIAVTTPQAQITLLYIEIIHTNTAGFYLFYTPSGCIIQWMISNKTTLKNKHNINEDEA